MPAPATAGVVLLSNPAAFSGNETLLTFQGVQPFQDVTGFGGVGFRTLGPSSVVGVSGAIDLFPVREFGPQEGTILNQFQFNTLGVEITLPSAVTRLGFELRTFPNAGGVLSLDLFAGPAAVESFTIPNRGTSNYLFYGFESDTPFDRLVLRGPQDGRFGLDNLRFESGGAAAVPGPASLALLGAGLAAVAARRRFARSTTGAETV